MITGLFFVKCLLEFLYARLFKLLLFLETIASDDVFLVTKLHQLYGDASFLDGLTHAQVHEHVLTTLLLQQRHHQQQQHRVSICQILSRSWSSSTPLCQSINSRRAIVYVLLPLLTLSYHEQEQSSGRQRSVSPDLLHGILFPSLGGKSTVLQLLSVN